MTGKAYVNSIKLSGGRLVQGINTDEFDEQLNSIDPSAAQQLSASRISFMSFSNIDSQVRLPSLTSQVLARNA
jgi:hypothetical protein